MEHVLRVRRFTFLFNVSPWNTNSEKFSRHKRAYLTTHKLKQSRLTGGQIDAVEGVALATRKVGARARKPPVSSELKDEIHSLVRTSRSSRRQRNALPSLPVAATFEIWRTYANPPWLIVQYNYIVSSLKLGSKKNTSNDTRGQLRARRLSCVEDLWRRSTSIDCALDPYSFRISQRIRKP